MARAHGARAQMARLQEAARLPETARAQMARLQALRQRTP